MTMNEIKKEQNNLKYKPSKIEDNLKEESDDQDEKIFQTKYNMYIILYNECDFPK